MRRTPSRKARPGRGREGARAWYLLIHQLPPEPLYLRAKIRQRLARVGAVALKNAVYVLPRLQDCLEDFEWLAQEAIAGGGEAHVCEAAFLEKETDAALVERFRQERDADYAALAASLRRSRKAGRRGGAIPRRRTSRRAWPVRANAWKRSRASTSSGRKGARRSSAWSRPWSAASSRDRNPRAAAAARGRR